jgi:DNA-directed RNA polymerase subunit RPC12/RpoP
VLFDTNISAAVRCSNCGKLVIRDISLFDLSRYSVHEVSCECGNTILKIKSSDYKTFRMYINCIACEKEHLYVFNSRQVLSEKVKILSCPASSLDIAFVGNKDLVREVALKAQRDLQELIKVLEV